MPGSILQTVRRAELLRDGGGLSDGQLLDAFVASRDEDAFAALVQRRGPLVLGVCRRVLGNSHDAEDAFQAAFMVLARRAGEIGRHDRLAGWLYGVAYRTALEARSRLSPRRARELEVHDMPHPTETRSDSWHEVRPILDAEVNRLPEDLRLPIVLCDIEGRSRKDVAKELGLAAGALAYRLTRGRKLLADRLTRRGIVLTAGTFATIAASAQADVSRSLVNNTVRSAVAFAAGSAAVPSNLVHLAQGVMTTMFLTKIKAVAGVAVIAAMLVAGVVTCRSFADDPPPPPVKKPEPPTQPPAKPVEPAKSPGRIFLHKGFELLSMEPDSTDPKNLANLPQADVQGYQPYSARISPDGKVMAFGKAVLKADDKGNLGSHPPDTLCLRDLNESKEGEKLALFENQELHNWVWSADGTKIAAVTWNKEHSTRNWIVDVKTKDVKEITLPKFKFEDKEVSMAIQAWSPDGKSFVASGNGLHLIKADGSDPKRLTPDGRIHTGHVRFSPDGRTVLYVSQSLDDEMLSIRTIDLQTKKTQTIAEGKNFYRVDAHWSPDGKRIAYCVTFKDDNNTGESETTLFTVDANGKNTVTVMTEKHPTHHVVFVLTAWR